MITGVRAATFSDIFDRAVAACSMAQQLSARSADAMTRARATRASARRIRRIAIDARVAWGEADVAFDVMRRQVEVVAMEMRGAGMTRHDASAAVRAHVRFVLYDGGLGERDAEPVVQRASAWVDTVYEAA
jgi:hypothetical protein